MLKVFRGENFGVYFSRGAIWEGEGCIGKKKEGGRWEAGGGSLEGARERHGKKYNRNPEKYTTTNILQEICPRKWKMYPEKRTQKHVHRFPEKLTGN
jgi:hypothetical protein